MTTQRLRDVLDAVAAISSDLSLQTLLARITEAAAHLVDARHGYLDVLDRRADRRIGSWATYGIDESEEEGRSGRELLVELMAAPATAGVDAAAFIGAPITINGFVFGNLYLMDKVTGSGFDAEDQEVALALASAAGIVVENARLHEQDARQRRWLEAAGDITLALLGPVSRRGALQLVADRAREVAGADFVALLMPIDDDFLRVEAVSGPASDGVAGERIAMGDGLISDAVRTQATAVVADTSVEPRYHPDKTVHWPDLGSILVLPLRSPGQTGALIVGWLTGHRAERWELDPDVPQRFADQAALVLQVARAQVDQGRLAVFEDRDRIGRDLHDLVIQRLFAIGLMLDNTTKLIESREAADRLSSAIDELDQTIKDIRRTIFELSTPPDASDLRAELGQIVDSSAALLGFRPQLRLTGPVDSVVADDVRDHLVAVVGEALSNIVRHADASEVVVELDVDGGIGLVVTDDGRGLGESRPGTGLHNMRHRAELLGGSCEVHSEPGQGVTVQWAVPGRTS